MEIGRRIYYDKTTGDVLVDTGQRSGDVTQTTVDEEIEIYKALNERTRESFDYMQLGYDDYGKDFMECNGYKINVETRGIEFSYPTPGEEPTATPVYRKPMSVEIEETKQALSDTNSMVLELMETLLGGM